MKDDGRAQTIEVVGAELDKIEERLTKLSQLKMTQQEVVQAFQDSINAMLKAFEETTGYRAEQSAMLPPVLKAVIESAGAPSDGWRIEIGWTFTPVTQPEKTTTPTQ